MSRPLIAVLLAGAVAVSTTKPAEARWGWGWGWGLGAFAIGALIGAALWRPAYSYYYPSYGYPAYGYGYGYPAYTYGYGYPSYYYGGYGGYYPPYYGGGHCGALCPPAPRGATPIPFLGEEKHPPTPPRAPSTIAARPAPRFAFSGPPPP